MTTPDPAPKVGDVVRERVARHLHRMLSPRGEEADRDWAEMNRWRRNMYLTEADRVIALVGGEVHRMTSTDRHTASPTCTCVTMERIRQAERECPRYTDESAKCLCIPLVVIDDERRRCKVHGWKALGHDSP